MFMLKILEAVLKILHNDKTEWRESTNAAAPVRVATFDYQQ